MSTALALQPGSQGVQSQTPLFYASSRLNASAPSCKFTPLRVSEKLCHSNTAICHNIPHLEAIGSDARTRIAKRGTCILSGKGDASIVTIDRKCIHEGSKHPSIRCGYNVCEIQIMC